MKKRILCVLLAEVFLFSLCQAKYVSSDNAAIVAEKFLADKGFPQKKLLLHHPGKMGPALTRSQSSVAPAYYIFTMTDKAGFVIVSADDVAKPILGYSFDGTLEDGGSLPPNMQAWLDDAEQQIMRARKLGVQQSAETAKQWKAPTVGKTMFQLQTAKWSQHYPFNTQCPIDKDKNSITGCVPTAHAILMKYYEYPSKGRGKTKEYTVVKNGIKVAERDLDHPYRWNVMRMEYQNGQFSQTQVDAVAELMADIGAAIQAQYSADETSAMVGNKALFAHFGFNPGRCLNKKNYTDSEWNAMVREELNKSRPLLYSSSSSKDEGGHAFIIDGYTNQDYYYINWGWGGNYNGVFSLDALHPGNYDYDGPQYAYFDCVPATMLPSIAKVNDSEECPSLKAALSLTSSDGSPTTIKIIQDASIINELIEPDDNVILDLNGCLLDFSFSGIHNYGQLSIVDNQGKGKIIGKKGNTGIINNYGVLNISGGEFVNEMPGVDSLDYRRCIWTNGGSTTTIKNGKFTSPYVTLCFNGDAIIENGDFHTTGNCAVITNYSTTGQVTITGGTFTNTCQQPDDRDYRRSVWTSQGTTTIIKNGKFTSPIQTLCFNGDATIEGGDFQATGNSSVLSNYNTSGQLFIAGGTFTNIGQKSEETDYRRCVWTAQGSLTNISSGIFTNDSESQTLCFNGNAEISGAIIENKGSGISCASNADVTISYCMISGELLFYAWSGATLKCFSGLYSQNVVDYYLPVGCQCILNKDVATKQKYPFQVVDPNGIEVLPQSEISEYQYYGINGMVLPEKKPGLIIVRDKSGKAVKRFYKK